MAELIDSKEYQVIAETPVGSGGGCFMAGTQVQLKDGKLISIEDIKEGDEVLSFDQYGEIHLGKVTKHHIHKDPQPIIKVRFWSGEIFITPNHWVLNQFNAFVEIQTLVTGHDTVVSGMGHLLPICSKEFVSNEVVYNLTVEPYHTFIADGIRVHNGGHRERFPIVTGSGGGSSKGGGGAPRQAVEDPDSLQSKATIKIIDLIGEGQIGGLVDGAKSIFLNDTALMSTSGQYNFTSTTFDSRTGTPNQDVIPGFSSIETPRNMSSIEVTTVAPQTFSITNLNVDRVRVVMNIPTLITQDKTTGDIHGNTVRYHFMLSVDGGTYVKIGDDVKVSGKCKSKYQKSHVLTLPSASTGWVVKVVRDSIDSVDSASINKIYIDSYVEITDAKLNYPNSALISVGVDPTVFSSVPSRSYLVSGLYIKVPNNVGIDAKGRSTGIYSGIWDGGFTTAISSNPAWILYDLLTATRYGLGNYLSESQVDKSMLYTIGKYCDELIDDGFGGGGKEPRFSINTQIQTQAEAYKVISDITSAFRGMAYWNGGMVCFRQDSPATPSMVFNQANVINGEFSYTSSSRKDRHSVVNVTWNDPDYNYKQRVEYVEDHDLIVAMGVKKLDTIAFGCSSRGQANRVGKWILYSEKAESNLITFNVGLDSSLLLPGEIVRICDAFKAGKRAGGRILSSTSTSLTLDASVTLSLGTGINAVASISVFIAMSDGSFVERDIIETTGAVSTITWVDPLAELPLDNAIYILSDTLVPMLARVISVSQNGKEANSFTVIATEHNSDKFGAIESGYILKKPNTSISQPYVTVLSKLFLEESTYFVAPGVIASKLHISWEGQASLFRVSYRTTSVTETQGITNILGSTFNGNFTTYFNARLTLINAIAAKVALNKIDSDAVITLISAGASITVAEQSSLMSEWNKIGAEKSYLNDLATTYDVTTQLNTYNNTIIALNNYLTIITTSTNWFSTTLSTVIVTATFKTNFTNVYNARLALLNIIASNASANATTSGTLILSAVGGLTGTTLPAANNAMIRAEWDSSYNEDPILVDSANFYTLTDDASTYHSAFVTLSVYLNGGAAWSYGAPSWLTTVSSSNWQTAEVNVPVYDIANLYEGNVVDVKVSGKSLSNVWTTPITATATIAGKSMPPQAVATFTATSLIRSIRLNWTYPSPMDIDFDHVIIRWSESSSVESNATVLTQVYGNSFLVTGLNFASTPYYFWIKTVDTSGNESNSSVYVTQSTLDEAGAMVATLAGKIGASELNTTLGTRINLIDGNASTTGSVAYRVAQEAAARSAEILTETNARIAASTAESTARTAAILAETTARTAAILVETNARGAALLTEAANRGTAISAEQTLRSSGDAQLAQSISLLTASTSAGFDAVKTWYFDTSLESWSAQGATVVWDNGKTKITSSGVDPQLFSPAALAIDGSAYTIVKISVSRVSAGSGWDGTLFYSTSAHTFTSGFYKKIAVAPTELSTVGSTVVLEFYMSSLTVGGTDWATSTITQLRLDLGSTSSDIFAIDWIAIGRSGPASASSGILAEQLARVDADAAIAATVTTLSAQVNHASTGLPQTRADLGTEQTTRATADTANANSITALSAQVNHATTGLPQTRAELVTEATTRATADTANATSISTLSSQVNHASTGLPQTRSDLATELITRADADTANAANITTLSSQVNHATTGLPKTRAELTTEATTRATADTANATNITTLSNQVNNVLTGLPQTRADLITEQTTRATADTANATNITTLSTQVNNATTGLPKTRADLTTEQTTRATADTANAASIATLSAQVNNVTTGLPQTRADLVTESAARSTADTANATDITTLSAQVNHVTTGLPKTVANLATEVTARTTADTALSTSVTALSAQVNNATNGLPQTRADLITEQTTRADADSANALSITTLSTTVGSNTTAISTQASSINGLNASYTVKIDTNGYVSGYGLASVANNGVSVSSFAIRADKFSIANPVGPYNATTNPNGSAPIVPFSVLTTATTIDGSVFPAGVYINNAYITKITADKIDSRGLSIRDGTGKVIFAAGTALDYSTGVGGAEKPADNATKTLVYSQATVPSAPNEGDVWYVSAALSGYVTGAIYLYKSSAWVRTADSTVSQLGGTGVNVLNPRYATFEETQLPPNNAVIGVGDTWSLDNTAGNFVFGTQSLYLNKVSTTANTYFVCGTANETGNISVEPNKKWIFSCYIKSSVVSKQITFYFRKAGDVNLKSVVLTSSSTVNTWTRASALLDLSLISDTLIYLIIDPSDSTAVDLHFDGLMLEAQVGNLTAPSPYHEPVNFLNTYLGDLNATRNVLRGDWLTATAYLVGDIVFDAKGYGWSCITAHTSSASLILPVYPITSNVNWTTYVVKGESPASVHLSNEFTGFPATVSGYAAGDITFSGANCDVTTFIGDTQLTPITIAAGSYPASLTLTATPNAMTYDATTGTLSSAKSYYLVTAMSGNNLTIANHPFATLFQGVQYRSTGAAITGTSTSCLAVSTGVNTITLTGNVAIPIGSLVAGTLYYLGAVGTASQANWSTVTGITSSTHAPGELFTCSGPLVVSGVVTTVNAYGYAYPVKVLTGTLPTGVEHRVTDANWTSSGYSSTSFTGGAKLTFNPVNLAQIMVGLSTNPAADFGTVIHYSLYTNGGNTLQVYESGVNKGTFGTGLVSTDLLSIIYNNDKVSYYRNGQCLRTVDVASGQTFYLDSSSPFGNTFYPSSVTGLSFSAYANDYANKFTTYITKSNVTIADGTISGLKYALGNPTAMAADTAYVDVVVTPRDAKDNPLPEITKRVGYVLNRAGDVGADSSSYSLVLSSSVITKSTLNILTPATSTASIYKVTGTSAPVLYSGRFVIATYDGATYTDAYTSAADISSYAYTVPVTAKAIRVRAYLAGGVATLLDEAIITIVSDGYNGIDSNNSVFAVLSNDSQTIPASSLGVTGTFSAASTLSVYYGSIADSTNWAYSKVDTNTTSTIDAATGLVTVTALSADTGNVTVTATRATAAQVNMLSGSETYDTAQGWGSLMSTSGTLSTSTVIAPNGSLTAKKITVISAINQFLRKTPTTAFAAGQYSVSTYIYVPTQAGVNYWKASWDFGDATTITQSIGNCYAFDTWVRVEGTGTTSASLAFLDTNVTMNNVACASGAIFHLWGGMCKTGAASGKYIPYLAPISKAFALSKAKAGVGSISVILSNETHTFPATTAGVVSDYTGSGTTIKVYDGATEVTYDGVGTATNVAGVYTGTWNVTAVGTNITSSTKVDSGTYATYPDMSAGVISTVDTSTIVYTITGTTGNGTAFTINQQQSFAKSKAGATGSSSASAAAFAISNSGSIFIKNAAGTILPAGITITTYDQNISLQTYAWYKDGTVISGATANSYAIPTTDYTSSTTHTYKCIVTGTVAGVSGQTLQDSITVPLVVDGSSSPTVILSNENITFKADSSGYSNIVYTGGNCDVIAYIGTTKLSYAATGANTFSCTNVTVSGCTVATGTGATYTYSVVSPTMTADIGYNDVVITIRDGTGTALASGTITKRISYSLSRAGGSAALFSINNSAATFNKNAGGVTSPTSITLSTTIQNIAASPVPTYQWQKNGTDIATATTSSLQVVANTDYPSGTSTNTYKCTVTGTINQVASSTLTDSITIPVLTDGISVPTVLLSNESTIFAGQAGSGYSGITFTGGDCSITAFIGSTQLTYDANADATLRAANTFSCTATSVGATVAAGAVSGSALVIPKPTGMSSDLAYTDVSIIIRDASKTALPAISKRISYSLSRIGVLNIDPSVVYSFAGSVPTVTPAIALSNCAAASSNNGTSVAITSSTADPYITFSGLSLNPVDNYIITLRVKIPVGTAVDTSLYYVNPQHAGTEATKLSVTGLAATGNWQDIVIDASTNAGWMTGGLISSIRFDFIAAIASFDLAYIAIGKYGVSKGIDGISGDSVDIIFARGASLTAAPSAALTASLTPPTGWVSNVADVAAGVYPIWSSVGIQTRATGNYTWQNPNKIEGTNIAEVTVYTRSTSPTAPATITYTFGIASPLTTPVGSIWSSTIPTGTDPVYTSKAVVSASAGYTSAVAITGWSTPVVSLQNGAVGNSGADARTVDLTAVAQIFNYTSAGITASPVSSVITATPRNATGTVTYVFKKNGVSVQAASATATYTYTPPANYSTTSDQMTVEMYEGGVLMATDRIAMACLKPGATGATGAAGSNGIDGTNGIAGVNGVNGTNGTNGTTTYTWIAYATNSTGTTGFTNGAWTNQTYIGIANNKTTATESTTASDYNWSLMKGTDGVPGTPGIDGTTTYTWFAYATNATGTAGFTTGAWTNQTYIGIATNKTTATESTTPADYSWSLIQGATGATGSTGAQGPSVSLTSNIDATFNLTDSVLNTTGNADIVFTATVSGLTSPTYAWTFSGLDISPLSTGTAPLLSTTNTQSISKTQFGASLGALVTCTVTVGGLTYIDKMTITRSDTSTAHAGATVGADSTNLNVGLGKNVLANSGFTLGTDHWISNYVKSWAMPSWTLDGLQATSYMVANTYAQAGAIGYFYTDTLSYPSVIAGKRYEASVYTGAHRCTVDMYVTWLDSTGTAISNSFSSAQNISESTGGVNLTGYKRLSLFAVAPTGAVKAQIVLRKSANNKITVGSLGVSTNYYIQSLGTGVSATTQAQWNTIGGTSAAPISYSVGQLINCKNAGVGMGNGAVYETSSYGFFAMPFFAVATAAQSDLSDWSEGMSGSIMQITNANASTYIAAAAIDTAYISNAAIVTAKIDDLAVTTGKIANLAVDTLQIAGNAVIVPVSTFSEAPVAISGGGYVGFWKTVATATADLSGGSSSSVLRIDTFVYPKAVMSSDGYTYDQLHTSASNFSVNGVRLQNATTLAVIKLLPLTNGGFSHSMFCNTSITINLQFFMASPQIPASDSIISTRILNLLGAKSSV